MRIFLAVLLTVAVAAAQAQESERNAKQLFSSAGLVFPAAGNRPVRIRKEQQPAKEEVAGSQTQIQTASVASKDANEGFAPVTRSAAAPRRSAPSPVTQAQEKSDVYEEEEALPRPQRVKAERPQEAPTKRKLPNYPQEYLNKRPQANDEPRKRPTPPPPQEEEEYEEEEALEEEEEEAKPDKLALLLQKTQFTCSDKKDGYYADDSLNCEVFHYCQDRVKHSWLCPEGAIFHQVHLICMPVSDDNICQKSSKFHFVNDYLYKTVDDSKDGSAIYADRYYPEGYEHGVPYDLDKVEAPKTPSYRPFQETYPRKQPVREPVKESNYRQPSRDAPRPPQYAPVRPTNFYDNERQGSESRPQLQERIRPQYQQQQAEDYDDEEEDEY